jgi:hypothetical protein
MPYPWLMREKQIRVAIDPTLNDALERIIKSRCLESPEQCVNEILAIYIASFHGPPMHPVGDSASETELLRREIARLEELLERKERALSTLVDLFEEFVIERDRKEEGEATDTEDRVSQLIKDWYYDAERKDQSGADGGKPGHV